MLAGDKRIFSSTPFVFSLRGLPLQKSTSILFSIAFKKRKSRGNLKHFIDAVASLSRAFHVHESIDLQASRFTLHR